MNNRSSTILEIGFFLMIFLLGTAAIFDNKQKMMITHSIFIAGPQFTGIIDEEGKDIWNAGKSGARDGYVLPNGNILICWSDEVNEYDDDKQLVFSFKRSAKKK